MIPTRIKSLSPAMRWEEAMVSGNGSTGIMVMGRPLDETIIVNHEKLWTVMAREEPQVPDLAEAWRKARELAFQGRYRDAKANWEEARRTLVDPLVAADRSTNRYRILYDHIHPGLHLHLSLFAHGRIEQYRRETVLDTGEVIVRWSDTRGEWLRRTFVSRTSDVIVLELTAPEGEVADGLLRLTEAPGKGPDEIGAVDIRHTEDEMYFHAAYARTMGKAAAEGYHLLARVIPHGGSVRVVGNEGITFQSSKRLLVLMCLKYLDRAADADIDGLRQSLDALPASYEALLAEHAPVHGEMFHRVTVDFGTSEAQGQSTEALLKSTRETGLSPHWLELMHAMGRYTLISAGTGELPVALSGIWGNDWNPPWDGRYTIDANINLAISGVSQGNLPEAMASYCNLIARSMEDWRLSAGQVFGYRGVFADLCQGWRHGKALMHYPWVGGAGWLASYVYDHYLYTGDKEFLKTAVLPLLRETAFFYEEFLAGTEDDSGRVVFYPSVSPENSPIIENGDQGSSVVPNSTCDIAICREALSHAIATCRELGVEAEAVGRWEALLAKLPEYVINEDGALAEWAYPGMGDRYNHRHASHLYPLWPALECHPEENPELFRAARRALQMRLEAGLGNKSAHGLLHICLAAARLRDPDLLWRMLDDFARLEFVNSGLVTCHDPGLRFFNCDASFTLPSIVMKMLVHSEAGRLDLLPGLPREQLRQGTVHGLRARGGITLERLHWNIRTHRLELDLCSQTEQTLVLNCQIPLRSVAEVGAEPAGVFISGRDRGEWQVHLPAETRIQLLCGL